MEKENIAESRQLAKQDLSPEIIEKIVTKGDLSGLSIQQKLAYLKYTCERLELNPAAQPFNLISFKQGNSYKEVLYCTKAGAEQITKNNKVSHQIISEKEEKGLYIVKARASLPDSRFVEDMGIVDISKGFSGGPPSNTELANLMLKAITKAKRRATLSLLGLGMMDETEAETLPENKVIDISPKKNELPPKETNGENKISPISDGIGEGICANCGVVIKSKKVIENSMKEFGKVLCWKNQSDCQEVVRNAQKTDAEFSVPEFEHEEVI